MPPESGAILTGSPDDDCKWVPGGIFYRNTVLLGRIKLFLNTGLIENGRMIVR
jgi:hypothetical protein